MCKIYLEGLAVSTNELLLWMTARGQGSWQQFRTATEELHLAGSDSDAVGEDEDDSADQFALPLYQALRLNLQRLGHAEFFAGAGDSDWRIAPPSLAITQYAGGCVGVLAGARSQQLLRQFQVAAASVHLDTLPSPACPDQIRITAGDASTLAAVAASAGLLLQNDAPAAILTCLPPVDNPAVRRRTNLPFGADWKIEQFSHSNLGWRAATRKEALSTTVGLFRFSLRHQRHVLLCTKNSAFQVPAQVGKYLVLSRRRCRVIRYEAVKQRLSVPASCRPPFLVERALILCSGLLPSYEARSAATGFLHYSDIPEAIAGLAYALLRQELR